MPSIAAKEKLRALEQVMRVFSDPIRYHLKGGNTHDICAGYQSKTDLVKLGETGQQIQVPVFYIRRADIPRPPAIGDRITYGNTTYELRQPPIDRGQVAWEIPVSAVDRRP